MNNEIEEQFPWVPIIKRGFLKSFSDDYDIGTLELLQKNIVEEIQRIKPKSDLKIARLLFECVEDFYYHFCRKWYQRKKFSPHMEVAWVHILISFIKIGLLLGQGNKNSKWMHRLLAAIMRFQGKNNLIYDALLSIHSLKKKYQCAYGAVLMHILIYIPTFVPVIIDDPAEYLKVYLLVRRLKYLIKDPVEKAELRMKTSKIFAPPTLSIWLLDHDFNATWMNSVGKINLGINICKKLKGKGSKKVVVETLRKVLLPGISTEIRAEQRASCLDLNQTILSATKKKNVYRNPENSQTYTINPAEMRNNVTCSNPFLSKDNEEVTVCKTEIKMKRKDLQITCNNQALSKEKNETTVNEIKEKKMQKRKHASMILYDSLLFKDNNDQTLSEVDKEENITGKNRKIQKRKNYSSTFQYDPFPSEYDDEHLNINNSEIKKPIENIKDTVVSEDNAFNAINHPLTTNVFENSKLVISEKNKKIKENMQCKIKQDDLPYHECSLKSAKKIKKQKNQKINKVAEKRNKVSQNCIDSFLLKDIKGSLFDEPNKVHLIHQSDESKRKKRKQREEVPIVKKNLEIINETPNNHILPKKNSQFSEITENRQKKQKVQRTNKLDSNTKEIEFITLKSDSDAEDSPIIIDEINISKSIINEESCFSKCRNADSSICSDESDPVIVTEIRHYSNLGLNSSHKKKNKPKKTELKSNSGTKIKILAEFNNPSNYDSAIDQIAYDTINDAMQRNESVCAKSENFIEKEAHLNSLNNLTNLQNAMPFVESNLRLKIANKYHIPEEVMDSFVSNRKLTINDQQNPVSEVNITDSGIITEGENSTPTNNQTNKNVNHQNNKHEDEIQDSCPDSLNLIRKDQEKAISESNITDSGFISEGKKSRLSDNKTSVNINHQNNKHECEIQDSCPNSSNLMINDQEKPISESNITDSGFISEGKKSMPSDNQTCVNVYGQNCKQKEEIQNQHPDCSNEMKNGQRELLSKLNFTNEETNIFSENQVDVIINDQNCENVDLGKVVSSSMEGHTGQINETIEMSLQDSAAQTDIDYFPNQTSEFVKDYKNLKSVQNSECSDRSKEFPMQTDLKKEKLDIGISSDENCVKKIEKRIGKSESFVTEEFISDSNEVNFPEISFVNTEITKDNSRIFVENKIFENKPFFMAQKEKITQKDRFSESIIEKKLNLQEIETKDTKLISGSNLSSKIDSKVVYNSDINSSFEIDNLEVVKNNTCINTQNLSQNSSINDLQKYQIRGLFFDAKSSVLADANLPEDSQFLDKLVRQKLNSETINVKIKTPYCYAASELMENMLKLVEQASNVKDSSIRQSILKGNLTATLKNLSGDAAPANKKSVKCLSFIDISAENINNLCETSSFDCLAPKGSEFFQYRENSHDQEDDRSGDILSENKSVLKTDVGEYFSDASNETVSRESNFSLKGCYSSMSFDTATESSNPKNNYGMYNEKTEFSLKNTTESYQINKDRENDIRKLQDTKRNISIKNILPELSMLNPVVCLGKRCDSKNFTFVNSSVSADFHDTSTNSTVPSDFGDGDEGINKNKPSILCFKPFQTVSEVNKSVDSINEISIKPEVIEDLPSDMNVPITHKNIKIGEVEHYMKVEVQSEQNDLKKRCLETDKKLSVSERDQEPFELVCVKKLSQGQNGTECDKDQQCTKCDKDQELTETKKEKESEPSLRMKLRKRPVPFIQKLADIDENCSVSNQNTAAKCCMTLRSRNPPVSSSQDIKRGKSQIVTICSLNKLKTETNLDSYFSELCLNSPKSLRTKLNNSSNKSNSALVKDSSESPTCSQGSLCKILTPASIISSNDTRMKKQDTDPEGYNLRSRKSVVMPGRLKL